MWSKLSYIHRTLVLLGMYFTLLVVGYHVSIKKTLAVYEQVQAYAENVTQGPLPNLRVLKIKHDFLDSTFTTIQKIEYDRLLISEVGKMIEKHKVDLDQLEYKRIADSYLNVITLTGDFINLSKVLYDLEMNFYAGRIVSTEYSQVLEKKSKRKILFLKIYLEKNESQK